MKKIFAAVVTLLFIAGCTAVPPLSSGSGTPSAIAPEPSGAPASAQDDTAAIRALLPDKAGFRWRYFGFAEYAMTMDLKSVEQSGGGTVYAAVGSVADMSGGEAKGDFAVRVAYTVSPGVLRQKLEGNKAMDSVFPDIELIRTPLAAGTKWTQTSKAAAGGDAVLDCAIDAVRDSGGKKVYAVSYRQRGSDYYELREITEGLGVTSFQKLYEFETGGDLIGYQLYTQDTQSAMEGYAQWLPELGRQYTYFGLAEYGHKGQLVQVSSGDAEDIYEYRGVYSDGIGDESKFVIRYYADKERGTITEQVVSNERKGKGAEVNSKLHNLVLLKFPLSRGGKWSHQAKLDGKAVTVQAEIMQYDDAAGIAKVRYTAGGAAGYYGDTYVEERTFEKGYGMTAFSNLMPGDIGISAGDAQDPAKLDEAIRQHSFGYTMNKQGE
jgi:hypothetical protein